jgi:two-component system phosphate regulon sensor histidine kinase PhoR
MDAQPAALARILLDAARRLRDEVEPVAVYRVFHELLGDVVPHDGIVVSSYDQRDDSIRCEYAWVEGNEIDAATLPPLTLNRAGGGMQSRVIVSGEPLLTNEVEQQVQDTGTYYNVDAQGNVEKIPETPVRVSAAMMVPVTQEGRVTGVVQLMRDTGAYSAADLELFEALVGQMAAAVRGARLQKERRRLELAEAAAQARAAEREQAERVLAVVGDAILLVDADGRIALANRAADAIVGEELVGRAAADVFADWPALAEQIPIAADAAATREVTLPVGARWLAFVAVRSTDGVVYAFRDVTSERRLDEEKRDFVATVSHELRTPMAAVYGAAQTLLRRDVAITPERTRELLEVIAEQAQRLAHVTDEILLTTRLDRGELSVDRRPVDVAELTASTVRALTQRDDDATIEVDVAAAVPAALGDRDRIQQVLVNLIDNAMKYGEPPLRIDVAATPRSVTVEVSDGGPGIPASEHELIFEKFYRSDPQLSRSPGGTGLGLYISRELALRMGGELALRAAAHGTTFVLELPRA